MFINNFLFKYRSYTPIPLVFTIIYFSNISYPECFWGALLIGFGEYIRISAVRFAGGETRTLKVGAPSLCTSGPYARTRNPLYVGNIIIYLGVITLASGPQMWLLLAVCFIFFTIQYSLIIALEESTLHDLFGSAYQSYQENVPLLFPRLTAWKNNDDRKPKSLMKTLRTERRTLQNLSLILLILVIKNIYFIS
ncbi:MAG: isoprenylcysteine carboxylmethyltransferase family protein [Candidatus Marinimicrobia bacterium]|jgi:protein-S-isoprenylcysteine O-methyltransferase Ste14|nr:isoprenylcysteine carboxylmethyltransferase family protein [Candidatus Neomarinimicrobiota bacterium]MBT3495591.1 isoprenylcysteine carboxylmethyltransferase family protein [Candidatus Neomarinimicrobiota bacterium]MBT3731780.1 isoprenylcysteine carboxylmethyltransferase family protein [Candidatus Neomarinimicrobiota bacterium]MBT4144122.1 isoprenylcysteine carboxylmethyltransferase family protein [Candidatus Neomarinimicrobiota bacterium]MBT4177424.1 isoprenylcysteine carboxylmethyltransfer